MSPRALFNFSIYRASVHFLSFFPTTTFIKSTDIVRKYRAKMLKITINEYLKRKSERATRIEAVPSGGALFLESRNCTLIVNRI